MNRNKRNGGIDGLSKKRKKPVVQIKILLLMILVLISATFFIHLFLDYMLTSNNPGSESDPGKFLLNAKRPKCQACIQIGKECGAWNNGCGEYVNCGACSQGSYCSNGACISSKIPEDYIAYYRFDGGARDEAMKYNGAFLGNAKAVIDGQRGDVLGLDGVGDYITTAFIEQKGTGSICFFAKYDAVLDKQNTGSDGPDDRRFYAGIDGDYVYYGFGNASISSSGKILHGIVAGTWNLICLTGDGNTAKYYVNGLLKDSRSYYWRPGGNSVPFVIGGVKRVGGTSEFIKGRIDDLLIFNRPLTQTEIESIYKS
jgi:hypothetical protein